MTENVAVWPVVTVALEGCVAIVGASGVAVTVNVAALLVTVPTLSVTVTVNCAPLSEVTAAGVV